SGRPRAPHSTSAASDGRHLCDPGCVPDDSQRNIPSPPAGEKDARARPFPREAYVFGWLVICVVSAEGISSLLSGVLGTGIILICLVPVMVWLMHVRPRHETGKRKG